ncbi:MAG TPA: ACT domain-containing protein [Thermoanaerobaculia bacterium]
MSGRPLDDVVADSSFRFAGTYRWASVRAVRNCERHLLIARDEKETTVVTQHLDDVDVIDVNPDAWLLVSIDCANPFYCAGFISRISAPLSAAGIDILVISTFSRDWLFVKQDEAARAAAVLVDAGFRSGGGTPVS